MKKLLIALIALVAVLGIATKNFAQTDIPGTSTLPSGSYPGGQETYPHNTGLCYCGWYSVCHPKEYFLWTHINGDSMQLVPHLTQPEQTNFPTGSIFGGN